MNKFPNNWREHLAGNLPGAMVSEEEAEAGREEGFAYPDAVMRDYLNSTYRNGEALPDWAQAYA